MKHILPLCFVSLLVLSSCFNEVNDSVQLVSAFTNRQLAIPINDTSQTRDVAKILIVNYIDSLGCLRCKSHLPLWKNFIEDISLQFGSKVNVLIIMHPHRLIDAKYAIQRDSFSFPVCIDTTDIFNKVNHLPSDSRFHCFLLDSANCVILIGNPVQNSKIKDLYIRTICERLGGS